jgi:hypothetical protein
MGRFMMSLDNAEKVIRTAMHLIEDNQNSNIRLNANGGNSILVVCEPIDEIDYIQAMNKLMPNDKYEIIHLNDLLCEFIAENRSDIEDSFEFLQSSINQIFKIPDGEEGKDLFQLIIKAIEHSLKISKIPVLVNAGTLYGCGIDNVHLMENDLVMKAIFPLIILYPATKEKDKLMFLGKRPSSKYRCMIVE